MGSKKQAVSSRKTVFISYASEDRAVAQSVQLAIGENDYDVFFDRNALRSGGGYHTELREAVARADLLVFLVSAESVAPRRYSLTELKYARQRWAHPKGRVLPVMVRPVALTEVPDYLKAVTILEPEGNVAAEVAAAVSDLLPPPVRTVRVARTLRRREMVKSDPAGFLRYLDREMAVMGGLVAVSVLLCITGLTIHPLYEKIWSTGRPHVLAGVTMALLACGCFYGQLSHLTWVYRQIQLTYTRSDATAQDLNEWLLATDARDAWVRYRAGLMAAAVSAAAYGYATVTAVFPMLGTLTRWSLGLPLALVGVVMVADWYLSTRFPHAEHPLRDWLDRFVPDWLRRGGDDQR